MTSLKQDFWLNSLIATLSILEENPSIIRLHLQRTFVIGEVIANELQNHQEYDEIKNQKDADNITAALLFHDVGKVIIPDYIKKKTGRFTAKEFEENKKHTNSGAEIFNTLFTPYFDNSKKKQMIIDVIVSHHEQYDGSGYPNGLAGKNIPLIGRIMRIIDVVDALITKSEAQGLTHTKIKSYLAEQSGKSFDPKLVQVVLDKFDEIVESTKKYIK